MGKSISHETLTAATHHLVIEKAVGGEYSMPNGRKFWIDGQAAQEITRRVQEAIAHEINSTVPAENCKWVADVPDAYGKSWHCDTCGKCVFYENEPPVECIKDTDAPDNPWWKPNTSPQRATENEDG